MSTVVSKGMGAHRQGVIVGIGPVTVRFSLARGGYTDKAVTDHIYLEALPRPDDWIPPEGMPSVLLLKSPEWAVRKR